MLFRSNIEEIELGARPIEGVSTGTAGFLGVTLRGPEEPRLVSGFEEFRRLYGGYLPIDASTLPFAVEGFFQNGGQRCFIGRIVSGAAVAMSAVVGGVARITAIGPGVWGSRIAAKIEDASLAAMAPGRFQLTVMYWDTDPPLPLVDPTNPANITDLNRREPAR